APCGRICTRASYAPVVVPETKGQTPAKARNRVDFPEPDGPLTSTCSPRFIDTLLALTSGVPCGRRTATSLKLTADASPGARVMTGGVVAASLAAMME